MNSRWTTNVVKRNGKAVTVRADADGNIEILKILARYPILTVLDIAALTLKNRSAHAVNERIRFLKREPHKLVQVHRSQSDESRLHRSTRLAYHLTRKGVAFLQDKDVHVEYREPSIHFIHTLTENQVAASFEIGARNRFISFNDILDSSSTPQRIRETRDHSIPVKFSYRGKDYDRVIPDALPFAISYPNNTYRFYCLEVDLGTEQLRWSTSDRQTIERKFLSYLNVLDQRIYNTHFGFPNLTILFTTPNHTRLESMMNILPTLSTKYLNHFAFKDFPTIMGNTPQPTDRGWAFNQPWLQCGGKTVNLRG
ncbi:replication-relaxation family protein [Bradyrhizobium sp. 4]|uniref:replication-relaxation family protein n=1 Tax=Bradyrhizobium sp. 4 TaxID=2782678 RepID=UPI001FFFB0E4|nr:replication-relaxation family protein [Bradyrhizobium sp. 4]UPJ35865.1 replication-relaxation family protein [Bradyrhizobium sp. 4]